MITNILVWEWIYIHAYGLHNFYFSIDKLIEICYNNKVIDGFYKHSDEMFFTQITKNSGLSYVIFFVNDTQKNSTM